MKVGIFANTSLPESGGSYTFEQQVILSLFNLAGQSRHDFYIFNKSISLGEGFYSKNVNFIPLEENKILEFYNKFQDAFIFTMRKVIVPGSKFYISDLKTSLEKNIFNKQIDLMWFLTPECLTMEVPYILTLWDLQHRLQPYFPEVSKEGEWNSREGTYSQTLRRASFIITGTNIGKSEIEKFYQVPEERIKVLPLPAPNFNQSNLDVNIDVNILKKKYRIEKPYLFYPAQFWPHKNHANLLKSVQILKDQFNLVFDMVFTGSNKGNLNYVQNLSVELGIQEQVKFLGFVSQADLIALYRHAFALTFVSFFGPDNIPPLEAFTLGCPVVAAKVAGSEEQLGDAALFIDPKDARQIAEAVKLIHDNWEFRNTLIQKGFSHASKWSPEDYLNGVFQILDEFQSIRKCWGN